MDIVDPATRSRMMASIRGKDTKPELRARRYLHACGLRFRLHDRRLPGRPDLVFPARKVAVFVHGCFWHRHQGCPFSTTPAVRREFWDAKFFTNVRRDAHVKAALKNQGWEVITVWECETRDEIALDQIAWRIFAMRTRV